MSRRTDRVEEACKETLSEIIQREIKDPRIGFVTITQVRVTPDLRHAKVYVSVLGTDEEVAESLGGLASSKGYIKSALGKHLRIRNVPDLEFVNDTVTEEAVRLQRLFNLIHESDGDTNDAE